MLTVEEHQEETQRHCGTLLWDTPVGTIALPCLVWYLVFLSDDSEDHKLILGLTIHSAPISSYVDLRDPRVKEAPETSCCKPAGPPSSQPLSPLHAHETQHFAFLFPRFPSGLHPLASRHLGWVLLLSSSHSSVPLERNRRGSQTRPEACLRYDSADDCLVSQALADTEVQLNPPLMRI